jgi:hypothetical protein
MKTFILILILLFPICCLADNEFIGEWDIEVVNPTTSKFPYQLEVKYPKWMKITVENGKIIGEYVDQYDYKCAFPMITLTNNGKDLIFVNCGNTKNPDSYAPIHHAKIIDGKLKGIVISNSVLFEWIGTKRK